MKLKLPLLSPWQQGRTRTFRSNAALEALTKASTELTPNLVLYNYPSFSGAFSNLFAHLFHSQLNLPCLVLPLSSVEPLRVDDLCIEGLRKCYLLDFLGPKGFSAQLSRGTSCEVVAFEHRKSVIYMIPSDEDCCSKLKFNVNLEKCSSTAAYEYFSAMFSEMKSDEGGLLRSEDQENVEMILKYIEDGDLRRWSLPDTKAFDIGIRDWHSNLNCNTDRMMYRQLLELSATYLVTKGISYISSRQSAASKLLDKVLKLRLGRGFYGECLGVRVDCSSNLSDEIGRELSIKSAAAGLRFSRIEAITEFFLVLTPVLDDRSAFFANCLKCASWTDGAIKLLMKSVRPIGAVIYMQRNNLKMCLRSTDGVTDTSEVAKAYGGGGSPCSSSFI